jgi:hypothetical protein
MLSLLREEQMNASVKMARDDEILRNVIEINRNPLVDDAIELTKRNNSF